MPVVESTQEITWTGSTLPTVENAIERAWDHADYLVKLIRTEELREQVAIAAKVLAKYNFDTIAFTGISGALISIPTALAMNKKLLAVRKPHDSNGGSHSSRTVEGYIGSQRYIIMDDLVCTGETWRRIKDEIINVAPQAECIGVYTVCGNRVITPKWLM